MNHSEPNPSEPVNPELEAGSGPPVPTIEVQAEPAAAPKILGYCRECGKGLDESSVHNALGAIYCEEHRPKDPGAPPVFIPQQAPQFPTSASPYTALPYHAGQPPPLPPTSPMSVRTSPGLAFVLGMIPGVGAVYNGQYAKGLVHVILLGLAISVIGSGAASGYEPLFGLLISCFWFYMAFEAYHTAKKRQAGEEVDEFSSVFPRRGAAARIPVAPLVLIALGALFLLSNLEIIEMRKLLRYWPALLIVAGCYMIYTRLTDTALTDSAKGNEMANENQVLGSIRGPIVLITIGALFAIDYSTGISFGRTWPVLLIVIGVLHLFRRAGASRP